MRCGAGPGESQAQHPPRHDQVHLVAGRGDTLVHNQLTEYFLLGSFVSWMVALGSYLLLV